MATNGGPNIIEDGLVLAIDAANKKSYPGSGTTFTDLTRNDNNGTLQNAPTYSTNDLGTLSFNGTDEYIDFSATSTTNIRGSITAAMFCKSNGVSSTAWSIYWSGVSKYNQFILGPNSNNYKMSFLVHSGTWYPTDYNSRDWGQSGIDIRDWHYYTGVYNNSTGMLYLYVDGVEEDSADIGSLTLSDDPNSFVIGKRDVSTDYLNFTLSHAQIYNRALSQQEVLQNYNALKGRFGL